MSGAIVGVLLLGLTVYPVVVIIASYVVVLVHIYSCYILKSFLSDRFTLHWRCSLDVVVREAMVGPSFVGMFLRWLVLNLSISLFIQAF